MKKLDEYTKVKLIYSGELVFFAILFLVLGTLQLVGVIVPGERFLNIFKFVTLAGSAYLLFDFFFSCFNKQRRAKVCMVDKCSTVILPPYTITIDILLLSKNEYVLNNARFFIGPLFIAFSMIYLFQGIYHWYRPLLELFEDDEKKEVVDTQEAVVVEEKKED